jgi:bacillolysin
MRNQLFKQSVVKAFSLLTLFSLVVSAFGPGAGVATAQEGEPPTPPPQEESPEARALEALGAIITYDASGDARFISFEEPDKTIPRPDAVSPDTSRPDAAREFLATYGAVFGLTDANSNLLVKEETTAPKGSYVHFQQTFQGIPVFGGELIVQLDSNNNIRSANGEVTSDISVSTSPTIDGGTAAQTAIEAVAKWYATDSSRLTTTPPELWVYDPSLVGTGDDGPIQLAWRLEVSAIDLAPIRELVLVDAHLGSIALHFSQIDHMVTSAFQPDMATANVLPDKSNNSNVAYLGPTAFSASLLTYTSNNSSSLPGTLLCNQSQPNCTNGTNSDADKAHLYALQTFNYYDTNLGRNSINNAGMTLVSSVNYCQAGCPYANAFWNGVQMVYGSGFSQADDVVGHELTHGVTQYESNLFYYYQSGAINESLSDIFGEFVDQTNGTGTDTAGVKWKIGEDLPIGAIRDMANPTASPFFDPDKMSHSNYYEGPDDSGGVHTNSGVNNKAAVLMVDGGSFNSKTVTALGITKTARIYYEAATNLLTSGSDYLDLYNALYQACQTLIGQNSITSSDCTEVRDATQAVEMQLQPATNFNADVALCSAGQSPLDTFFDNLENGSSNWAFGKLNGDSFTRWQYDSPYGPFAHSGLHHLFGNDKPTPGSVGSDSYTAMTNSVTLSANAYLHFHHAYGFEDSGSNYYDGGILEYSTNGGGNWTQVPNNIIDTPTNYKGTIFSSGSVNPLAGKTAFVGDSHGYISTRVNLASLAGQSIRFRWRMGLDATIADWGWWVDDVRIYRCVTTALVNSILPTSRTTTVGTTVTIYNTVINGGSFYADDVTLSMANPPAGTFKYQQSNCANNALMGSDNPVLDIPAGGIVCYVLFFTPSATFNATEVHIRAQAANAPATAQLTGINTWLLRTTNPAGPDMVALTTTTDFHQVACSGSQDFAVAMTNVGAAATSSITATAEYGSLPISVLIRETDPPTGVVTGDHILENVGPGQNRSVLVTVTFNGCITFDPAINRIFIRFRDAGGNIVGSTSTAVSTNR